LQLLVEDEKERVQYKWRNKIVTNTENMTNIKTGQTLKHDCKNLNAADLHHFHLDTEIAKWLFSSGETLKRSLHTSYCSLKYFNTEITFHFHSFNPMLCFRSLWLTVRVIVEKQALSFVAFNTEIIQRIFLKILFMVFWYFWKQIIWNTTSILRSSALL
jgi:hypothetical protein